MKSIKKKTSANFRLFVVNCDKILFYNLVFIYFFKYETIVRFYVYARLDCNCWKRITVKCSVITVNLNLHFCIALCMANICPCYSKKTVIQFYSFYLCLHCNFTVYICSVCDFYIMTLDAGVFFPAFLHSFQ